MSLNIVGSVNALTITNSASTGQALVGTSTTSAGWTGIGLTGPTGPTGAGVTGARGFGFSTLFTSITTFNIDGTYTATTTPLQISSSYPVTANKYYQFEFTLLVSISDVVYLGIMTDNTAQIKYGNSGSTTLANTFTPNFTLGAVGTTCYLASRVLTYQTGYIRNNAFRCSTSGNVFLACQTTSGTSTLTISNSTIDFISS